MKTFSNHKIPSILGVIVLLLGVATGVMLIGRNQTFRLGASGETSPKGVRISNVTDKSFTISWTTQKNLLGYIKWGQTPSLGQTATPIDPSLKSVHSVTIEGLAPVSNYYFVINSSGDDFDNSGVPWSVTTGPTLPAPKGTVLASGTVRDAKGAPASNALVYINGGKIAQLSTTTSPNGSWTIPLSAARAKTLSSYASLIGDDSLEIFVQSKSETSVAQILFSGISPVPDIVLGQSYDFRGKSAVGVGGLPEANLNLPEEAPTTPGALDVSGETTNDETTVTLDSIDSSGEIIFTTSPEFFGDGPPNTEITITVESDPMTEDVIVPENGAWKWSPPKDLEEGEHTITINWRDASGLLRSLSRTFIVQAAEGEPSFESTPSGSTPTASASPTVKPTATPTISPTTSPTPTPAMSPTSSPTPTRASIPSTESGIPTAGSMAPTLILLCAGLILFASGIVISIKKN